MTQMTAIEGVNANDCAALNRARALLSSPRPGVTSSMAGEGAIGKAAESFEAVLLTSLFQQMQESVSELGQDTDCAQSSFQGLGAQELASGIAASGGIGIAKMIVPFLSRSR